MNKEEVVKGKNLFDEEKIIDTGIKEPLFIRIPFDEYKELKENSLYYRQELEKAWKENEKLKDRIEYLGNEKYALYQDNISLLKEKYGTESLHYKYIETPPVEVKGYISEDKIKAKIKELEKTKNYIISMYAIGILEELLGDE